MIFMHIDSSQGDISEFNQYLEQGKPILDILCDFYEAYMWCDELVAHNMYFDENMILLELERNYDMVLEKAPYCFRLFSSIYEKMNNINRYCTMRKGTMICNIRPLKNSNGTPFKFSTGNSTDNLEQAPHRDAVSNLRWYKTDVVRRDKSPSSSSTEDTEDPRKKTFCKWPKLTELYSVLFPEEVIPENMHNAMVDVMACLRCYLKMRHRINM
jgi:hypothetical protein